MNRWLARLSFSFFILAGLLLYQAYRETYTPGAPTPPRWRIALYCLGAGLSAGLAVQGLRHRHRPDDHRPDDHRPDDHRPDDDR